MLLMQNPCISRLSAAIIFTARYEQIFTNHLSQLIPKKRQKCKYIFKFAQYKE